MEKPRRDSTTPAAVPSVQRAGAAGSAFPFATKVMTTKVKICGITSEAALEAALDAGAEFIGLVFYPPSPRHLAPAAAAKLATKARGRAAVVVLLVDPDDALIDEVAAAVAPDLIQLHGSETPARVREIRARCARPVMKAIKVRTQEDTAAAEAYFGAADLILFDAAGPAGCLGILPGGNGIAFDWEALAPMKGRLFALSGGLTPDSVAEAVRRTGAAIVDVSSGVERAPGEKDPVLIRRFVAAAKSAAPAP